jgi:hypothetical protein
LINLFEIFVVVNIIGLVTFALLQIVVIRSLFRSVHPRGCQRIKRMEGALVFGNRRHPRFLKQIAGNVRPFDSVVRPEKYLHVLSESARIVVPYCLAVAERFEQGIAGQYFFLNAMTAFMAE